MKHLGVRALRGAGIAALLASAMVATPLVASSAASASSKAPIVIGSIVDITAPEVGGGFPEVKQAEVAAVAAVNKAGGIDGRPLKLIVCDSMFNPANVASCANSMVANKQLVAVVGSVTATSTPAPVLQAAGLEDFAPFAFEPPDTQDSVSSPLFSPLAGSECAASIGVKFYDPKPTQAGWVYVDLPGNSDQVPLITPFVTKAGATLSNVVPVSETATDLTPSVASAAAGGATSIGLGLTPGEDQQFIVAARSYGYTGAIGTLSLSTQDIKTLGSIANGVYVCEPFKPPTDKFPGGKEFLAQTKGIANFAIGTDSENGWIGVHMIADQLMKMKTITRATVRHALSNLTGASTFGFSPNYTNSKPYTGLGGAEPRLTARQEYYTEVENGNFALLSETPGTY